MSNFILKAEAEAEAKTEGDEGEWSAAAPAAPAPPAPAPVPAAPAPPRAELVDAIVSILVSRVTAESKGPTPLTRSEQEAALAVAPATPTAAVTVPVGADALDGQEQTQMNKRRQRLGCGLCIPTLRAIQRALVASGGAQQAFVGSRWVQGRAVAVLSVMDVVCGVSVVSRCTCVLLWNRIASF